MFCRVHFPGNLVGFSASWFNNGIIKLSIFDYVWGHEFYIANFGLFVSKDCGAKTLLASSFHTKKGLTPEFQVASETY